jgi:hypothetical protein
MPAEKSATRPKIDNMAAEAIEAGEDGAGIEGLGHGLGNGMGAIALRAYDGGRKIGFRQWMCFVG